MKKIEICSSKSLVLRRHVTFNGCKIFGAEELGRAALQHSTADTLRIHFSTSSIANQVLPWHFVCDSLLSELEVPAERHALLNSILHTQDFILIEDMVERAGLLEDMHPLPMRRGGHKRGYGINGSVDVSRRPTTS